MPSSVARGPDAPSQPLPIKGVVVDDAFLQQECCNASGDAVEALQVEENSKEDELIPPSEIQKRLREHLDKIMKTPNGFGFHEVLQDPPNPGLNIEGFGKIGFPLSKHDIQRIIEASHQADVNIEDSWEKISRPTTKVWEIPASHWTIENPSWQTFLKSLLARTNAGLGIRTGDDAIRLEAERVSLILYEPGGVVQSSQWYFM